MISQRQLAIHDIVENNIYLITIITINETHPEYLYKKSIRNIFSLLNLKDE